jgi:arsenate reductase-like glutaredoxin family protein
MNKDRVDFQSTPGYDEFLEYREDIINKFIKLYDTTGTVVPGGSSPPVSREELEKLLHKFEIENQEQIIHTRSTADERKRKKIESIIEEEGTLYERINVDFKERDSVIDHELAIQYSELLSKGDAKDRFNQHASADLINRRTRLIQQGSTANTSHNVPLIAEASGCKGLWMKRALDVLVKSFDNHNSF